MSCVPVANQEAKSGFEPRYLEALALSLIMVPLYHYGSAFPIPQTLLGD